MVVNKQLFCIFVLASLQSPTIHHFAIVAVLFHSTISWWNCHRFLTLRANRTVNQIVSLGMGNHWNQRGSNAFIVSTWTQCVEHFFDGMGGVVLIYLSWFSRSLMYICTSSHLQLAFSCFPFPTTKNLWAGATCVMMVQHVFPQSGFPNQSVGYPFSILHTCTTTEVWGACFSYSAEAEEANNVQTAYWQFPWRWHFFGLLYVVCGCATVPTSWHIEFGSFKTTTCEVTDSSRRLRSFLCNNHLNNKLREACAEQRTWPIQF